MDFNSNLYDIAGNRARIDRGNAYYGAGLGLGFIRDIGSHYSVDLEAQYKWLKLEKANVNLDAVSSHRTRVGGRLNYTANRQFTPYAGLAWEHEFTYKSSGSVYGYEMKEADGSGSSGVGEIGVSFNPDANGPFTIDANVQAYMGQREGVMGRVMANYRFQAFSPGRVAPVFLKCPREPSSGREMKKPRCHRGLFYW